MAKLSFYNKSKYNLRLFGFKLVDKLHFQLLSVLKYLENHLVLIREVMEGD